MQKIAKHKVRPFLPAKEQRPYWRSLAVMPKEDRAVVPCLTWSTPSAPDLRPRKPHINNEASLSYLQPIAFADPRDGKPTVGFARRRR